jgi:hypothetical protein
MRARITMVLLLGVLSLTACGGGSDSTGNVGVKNCNLGSSDLGSCTLD